ncbi:MAG: hypothetical protein ACLQMF_08750 [Rectinemataceae bacterium]
MKYSALIFAVALLFIPPTVAQNAAAAPIIGTWVLSAVDNAPPSGISETIVVTSGTAFTYTMSVVVGDAPTTLAGAGSITSTGGPDYVFTTIVRGGEGLPMPMSLSSDGNTLTGSGGFPPKTFVFTRS